MFEKEAEDYIDKLTEDWTDGEYSFSIDDMRKAILHFAEYGYNKGKHEEDVTQEKLFAEYVYARSLITDLLRNSDEYARQRAIDYIDNDKIEINKANEWHDLRKNPNDYPTEADKWIRCVFWNDDEYIGATEWYEPTEDEIGFGHLIIDIVCNGESLDLTSIKAWCEIPKFEVTE